MKTLSRLLFKTEKNISFKELNDTDKKLVLKEAKEIGFTFDPELCLSEILKTYFPQASQSHYIFSEKLAQTLSEALNICGLYKTIQPAHKYILEYSLSNKNMIAKQCGIKLSNKKIPKESKRTKKK